MGTIRVLAPAARGSQHAGTRSSAPDSGQATPLPLRHELQQQRKSARVRLASRGLLLPERSESRRLSADALSANGRGQSQAKERLSTLPLAHQTMPRYGAAMSWTHRTENWRLR